MTTRRLSETDLARFCALPVGPMLDQALRGYNAGGGGWSYDATRRFTAELANAQTPLIGPMERTPWAKLKREIERTCRRGEVEVQSNLQVGKALYEEVDLSRWSAVKETMGQMPVGVSEAVRYWSDVVFADDDGPFIPFFDYRRDHGIQTKAHRRIVFSMQHNWVRARNPDLADARLAIVRFPVNGDERQVSVTFGDEEEILSYDELNTLVRDVYSAWHRVSTEKARERRPTGTTPFGF